ncbi:hypothetical protein BGW42_002025 [Actinomortierella wolfii]|nr:hypothetical protein BGW42_002025 [Actinomortierella wolfii]
MPEPRAVLSDSPSPSRLKPTNSPHLPRKVPIDSKPQLPALVETKLGWPSAGGRLRSLVKSTPDLCLRAATRSQVIDSPSSDSAADSCSLHSTRTLSTIQSRTNDQEPSTPRCEEPAAALPSVTVHIKSHKDEQASSMSLVETLQGANILSFNTPFSKPKQRVIVQNKDDPSKAPVIAMDISPLSPFEPWPRSEELDRIDQAESTAPATARSAVNALPVVTSDPEVKEPRANEGLGATLPTPRIQIIGPRKKRERLVLSFSLVDSAEHNLTKAESIAQQWRRMQQQCVSTTSLSITRHDGSRDELVIPHDQGHFAWIVHNRQRQLLNACAERAASLEFLMGKPRLPVLPTTRAIEPHMVPLPPSPLIPDGSFDSLARKSSELYSPGTPTSRRHSYSGSQSGNREACELRCDPAEQLSVSEDLPQDKSSTKKKADNKEAAQVEDEGDTEEEFNLATEPQILYQTVVRRTLSSCSMPAGNDIENKVVSSKVSRKGRLFATKIKAIADYEYNTAKKLGKGNFGVVYEGRRIQANKTRPFSRATLESATSSLNGDAQEHEEFAIKKIERKLPREIEKLGLVDREMRVCRRFRNKEGIISLHDIITTQKHHYLIFEKAEGDLAGLIRDRQKALQGLSQCSVSASGVAETSPPPDGLLTAHELRQLMAPVARGLFVLHSQGYSHKDIKPANILYRGGRGLLCDFGLCSKAEELPSTQFFGTQEYASPEARRVRAGRGCDYICADVYSFGAVLFELATGQMLCKTISQGMDWAQLEAIGGKSFRYLMMGMLNHADCRWTMARVVASPFWSETENSMVSVPSTPVDAVPPPLSHPSHHTHHRHHHHHHPSVMGPLGVSAVVEVSGTEAGSISPALGVDVACPSDSQESSVTDSPCPSEESFKPDIKASSQQESEVYADN